MAKTKIMRKCIQFHLADICEGISLIVNGTISEGLPELIPWRNLQGIPAETSRRKSGGRPEDFLEKLLKVFFFGGISEGILRKSPEGNIPKKSRRYT